MANKKTLQQAAAKFRRENLALHFHYSALLSLMARFITKTGASEVKVGIHNGTLYEKANI